MKNRRRTIDELLANIGSECGLIDVFDDEKDYDEVVESFKIPKTIVIDLSAFETVSESRTKQMWNVILSELQKTDLDWKSKEVAVNFEHTESFKLGFGEMSDIIGLIQDQVRELYWTAGFADHTSITITYCSAKKMKLAIIGARVFDDYELLKREVLSRFKVCEIAQIVSGGAKGADTLAYQFGLEYGINMVIYPAKWRNHGRGAGYLRNTQIAEYADCAIAFPIGASKGTYDTIRKMEALGKPVTVIKNRVTPENIGTLTQNEVVVEYGPTGHGYGPSIEGQTCKVSISIGAEFQGLGILRFVKFAQKRPELVFYVTPIKSDIDDAHIAVWFRHAIGVSNIYLPQRYWDGIEYALENFHLNK